jgi:hypothetical protein
MRYVSAIASPRVFFSRIRAPENLASKQDLRLSVATGARIPSLDTIARNLDLCRVSLNTTKKKGQLHDINEAEWAKPTILLCPFPQKERGKKSSLSLQMQQWLTDDTQPLSTVARTRFGAGDRVGDLAMCCFPVPPFLKRKPNPAESQSPLQVSLAVCPGPSYSNQRRACSAPLAGSGIIAWYMMSSGRYIYARIVAVRSSSGRSL